MGGNVNRACAGEAISRVGSWLLFFSIVLLMSGCAPRTYYANISTDLDLEKPFLKKTKIPLRVGLYIEPEYLDFEAVLEDGSIVSLGPGLGKGAEAVLREAFQEVVIIESIGPQVSNQHVKAIITFSTNLPSNMSQIAFEWTIVGLDGRTLYMNTFRGEANTENISKRHYEEWLSESLSLATTDSFQKFLIHILSSRWWKSL